MIPAARGNDARCDLSVVIPTMNKVDLLGLTLAALQGQDPGAGRTFEIVVVNDGSSDGTADFLAALEEQEGAPALRIISPPANVGRARARNLGARAARGTWILFLDDDIVAPEGLLRAHLDLLTAHPGCGTIGFAVTDPGIVDAPHFHYLDTRGVARLPAGPAPGRYFVTQNAAVPRQAFLDIGGFDEGFSGYGFEDMEVAFRLEDQAGVRFLALPAPVPRHVHHHTLAQYFAKKRECGRQSLQYIALRHPRRVPEMHLHHVVDAPGQAAAGTVGRVIRAVADSPVGKWLPEALGGWPCGSGFRPRWPGLYFRLMNLAVLFCFRQGFLDGARGDKVAQSAPK
jgi:GT2 family glycosyltransferase